ncbi:MAG: hypothetical protein LBR60_09340 [Fibrobacter sp.]|nr:hypothetical protein [Fibrobacter sp.]
MKLKLTLLAITLFLAACTPTNENPWNAETVCPESARGSFQDERDDQWYNYTTIGNQVWMAENLSYRATNSLCYDNDPANCEIYGRMYQFSDTSEFKTICPQGWHLPTQAEWDELTESMGGGEKKVSDKLRTKEDWWKRVSGTNVCNFTALPGGTTGKIDEFNFINTSAHWWTSTRSARVKVYSVAVSGYYESTGGIASLWSANSIRCVKD